MFIPYDEESWLVIDTVVAGGVPARAALPASVRAGDLRGRTDAGDLGVGARIFEGHPFQPDIRVNYWPANQFEVLSAGQLVQRVSTGLDIHAPPIVLGENLTMGQYLHIVGRVVDKRDILEAPAAAAAAS